MFDAQHLYPIETVMQAFAVGVVLGFVICFKLTSTNTSTKEETPVFGFGKKNEIVPYKPSTAIQQSYAAPPVKPQKQKNQPAPIGSGLFGGFMGLPLAQEAKKGEMIIRTDGTGEWGNEAIVRFER